MNIPSLRGAILRLANQTATHKTQNLINVQLQGVAPY